MGEKELLQKAEVITVLYEERNLTARDIADRYGMSLWEVLEVLKNSRDVRKLKFLKKYNVT